MHTTFFFFAVFALLYSLVAKKLEETPVSGPVIFLLVGFAVGPFGLGLVDLGVSDADIRLLADMTLAVILFVDAVHAKEKVLDRYYWLPSRMLLVGLPGAILLGTVLAWAIFSATLSWAEMAILGVMLAATDAALGKAVVSNPQLPQRIRVGLNVESGLNDGICVPLLLLFIALATTDLTQQDTITLALTLVLKELGIGFLVGVVLSVLGAWSLNRVTRHGWLGGVWKQFPAVLLALCCFFLAQALHGSGYVAAFIGGLAFQIVAKEKAQTSVADAEGVGELLAMSTWIIVGEAIIGQAFGYFDLNVLVYAVLSLTVVRMLPIYVSLTNSGETVQTRLFLGWFGPRGLASLVFAFIVLDSGVPNAELIAVASVCTIFLSTILHGVSARPLSNRLAEKLKRSETQS